MICPIVFAWVEELYGLWKTYWISPRLACRARARRRQRSPAEGDLARVVRVQPAMQRASVVFPEPDSPTSARHSWGRTTRSTSKSTCRVPCEALIPPPRRARRRPRLGEGLGASVLAPRVGEHVGVLEAAHLVVLADPLDGRNSVRAALDGVRAARREEAPARPVPGPRSVPGMPTSAWCPDSSGIASTSRRVYGCAARRKSALVGPSSTSGPPYMTATRLARVATTARSWLT